MVPAGNSLFIAGPPDVLSEDGAFNRPSDQQVMAKISEQAAAYRGKCGALLVGVSTAKGNRSFRLKLSTPPVWDGMAVAEGRLFISRQDRRLSCLGAE